MTSNIDNTRINANFPRAGQDNDSQGFRDNFANIKVALGNAKSEISELQSKGLFKSALVGNGPGTTLTNDMAWGKLTRVQLSAPSVTYYDHGISSGEVIVDYLQGQMQKVTVSNNIVLLLTGWPPISQYGSVVIWFSVANPSYKVLLPASVVYGLENNRQIVNNQIVFPDAGDYLVEIASADSGTTFWLIDFANLGGSGGGEKGSTGATGVGASGVTGATGPSGQFGGITLAYRFRNTIADADPGDGYLAFNNANLEGASEMFIDVKDINGIDMQSFLRTIDDSTNPLKGHFKITNKINANDFAIFTITSMVEATGYFKVQCTRVSGALSFSNLEDVIITFARTGDIGATGLTGATGPQGPSGAFSAYGATGASGATGGPGATGPLGASGMQGIPGPIGPLGSTGATGPQGPIGLTGPTGGAANFGATGPAGPIGPIGPQGIPGVAAYKGATGSEGPRGATGPIGATGLTGATGADGLGDWINFDLSVPSPTPDKYDTQSITGFHAYNSTDFPGPYFIGLDLHGSSTAAQFAMNWNSEENAPSGMYFRTNDDTSDIRSWSPWRRVLLDNSLITPTAGNGPEYGIKFPNDPGGGGFDTAWIRYYAYSGEKTVMELGVSNDGYNTGGGQAGDVGIYQDSINFVSSGGVGINQRTPRYPFDVTGDIHATGDIIAFSDATLKTNIRTIETPLELMSKLRGVFFNKVESGEAGTGVIAQEVEPVIPELVKTDRDGLKSVNYGGFAGLFIESINALQVQVKELQDELAKLKGK